MPVRAATAATAPPAAELSPLALAAVSAVLKNTLDNSLARAGAAVSLGDVAVSVLPPDRVDLGTDERARLNLFLVRLSPQTAWSNGAGAPALLTLDAHYLLSAYGEHDFEAEILLGHAARALYARPVLTVDTIRAALASLARDASGAGGHARAALGVAGLAEAVGPLELRHEFVNMEELTRLWSALQANFRPSLIYRVSSVRIDARDP
jgi:hypothetical protein